ncbi:MAG: outer membrane beta-barrel protein [Parachlamydiaceae bacterium]|nr:outer membrane beta-barrel protein [Parachlamydiaceae bacterium]
MKKNTLFLLMSLIFFMSADAHAQGWGYEDFCCGNESNFYAKIFGGANFLQNGTVDGNKSTYKTGYLIAGSLGYSWCNGLSVEAEYAFRRNAIKNTRFFTEGSSQCGHFQTSSVMANILWDVPSLGCANWDFQPFVGAGIGYDFQQMHSANSRIDFNQKWNHFSWQLMAGLVYPIFCNTEMTLEYKFHQGGCHFYNHSVGIGLLYKFNL